VAQVLQLGVKSQSEVLRPCAAPDPALTRQASGVSRGRRRSGNSPGGSTGGHRSSRLPGEQLRGARKGEDWPGALPQEPSPERSWSYTSFSREKGACPRNPRGLRGPRAPAFLRPRALRCPWGGP